MQRQLETVEQWLTECNLTMNTEKTEYIVVGGDAGGALITHEGTRIKPQSAATYLGFERKNEEGTISHLSKRASQANKAALAKSTLLKRLPHLRINKQLQLTNA